MPDQGFVINVSTDITAFMGRLDQVQRENLPFVTAYALTQTALEIRDEEIEVMARVFDRPTRFTLNALQVEPATKQRLRAEVRFKDWPGKTIPAWRYLGPQVEGGARVKKGLERALERVGLLRPDEFCVPARTLKLDASGNIPGSLVEQMLSGLGAAEKTAGYMANGTPRSRKRNPQRGTYFVLRDVKGAPDGVYRRTGGRAIEGIVIFVSQPRYSKRFPFYETAKAIFESQFAKHFRIGMAKYGNQVRRMAA